jgi:hypothetical protein
MPTNHYYTFSPLPGQPAQPQVLRWLGMKIDEQTLQSLLKKGRPDTFLGAGLFDPFLHHP